MAERVVALLGGDQREFQVVPALLAAGWQVRVWGLPKGKLAVGAICCETIAEAVNGATVILLPLPGIRENGRLHAPFADHPLVSAEDLAGVPAGTPVVTGVASAYLRNLAAALRLSLTEVAENDRIAIPNAIPTAEGAVQIAMEETSVTVDGMRVLILGYGRVGAALCDKLHALGARVTVTNRGAGRFAAAVRDGCAVCPWRERREYLSGVEVVFNTIPAPVIGRSMLEKMEKNTVIIDLASPPGGTDFALAAEFGVKTIHALGLPGKVAPVTAGRILAAFYPALLADLTNEKRTGGDAYAER